MVGNLPRIAVFLCIVPVLGLARTDGLDLSANTLSRFDGSDIDYYLDRRDLSADRKGGILVIMQGTGCHSVTKSDRLEAMAGVDPDAAVLLVQKYGVPESASDESGTSDDCPEAFKQNNTIHQRVIDYVHVLADLSRQADWWNGELTLLGGSEGGVTASLVAALLPETDRLVAFSFLSSGTLRESLPVTVTRQMRESGAPPQAIESQLAEIREKLDEIASNPTPNKSMGSESTTYKWWASALDIKSLEALKQLDIPVLLLHGRRDSASDVKDARKTVDVLKSMGKDNVKYIEYKDLDYTFQDAEGTSHIDRVVKDIRAWLEGNGT